MSCNMHLIITSLTFVFAIIGIEKITSEIVRFLYKRIKKSMTRITEKEAENGNPKTIQALEEETKPFQLLELKKEDLGFITKIIGYLEISIFFYITILLSRSNTNLLDQTRFIGVAITGWLALKIFGGYQQWSGRVFGRATFYTFLIGSFINIGGAIIIGLATKDLL